MSVQQVVPYFDLLLSSPIEQRHLFDGSELYTRQLQGIDIQGLVGGDPKLHVPSGFPRGQVQLDRLVADGSTLDLDVRIAACPASPRRGLCRRRSSTISFPAPSPQRQCDTTPHRATA